MDSRDRCVGFPIVAAVSRPQDSSMSLRFYALTTLALTEGTLAMALRVSTISLA